MTQEKDWIACNEDDVLAIVQISKRLSNEFLPRKKQHLPQVGSYIGSLKTYK